MLSYDILKAGTDSLYHFLYDSIKKDILKGLLKKDERLPSKRAFAQNLGVSVITVETAYNQLLAEGYLYSLPKKGFYVAAIESQNFSNINNLKRRTIDTPSKKSDDFNKINSKYSIDFVSNGSEVESFPFSTWAKITREILCEKQKELLQVSPGMGIFELRKAIAKMLKEFRNIQVDVNQIVIGAGTDYLYGLLLQLLGFNKCYAIEDPGYHKISEIYSKYNVDYKFIPIENFIYELEKSEAEVVHISPSHHFPTGKVMPIGERYKLLSWASQNDNRYIIEDDYDSEFRMVGRPIPALQNIDVMDKVVYLNTFSKTMTSTIRLSYMVLPKHLAVRFKNEFYFYSCTVSNLDQYVMAKFMNEGYFETHINRMRNFYKSKRDLFLSIIKKSKLFNIVEIFEEDAGLHFILKINTKLKDFEFCKKAAQKGIYLKALSEYYFEAKPSEHKFIINYSSIEKKKMPKAIEILEGIVK